MTENMWKWWIIGMIAAPVTLAIALRLGSQ